MVAALDTFDAGLLDALQAGVPLVEQPYEALGDALGLRESDVLARVARHKARPGGIVRQVSAIFDSKSLGYQSCLVAARVDESILGAAVAAINAHPGVSHNYRRNHAYNLWYTVAVPPDSRLGLERTVEALHLRSGATATRLLPALKVYKIGVKFNLGDADVTAQGEAPVSRYGAAAGTKITEKDKRLIRVLQQDLPVVSRPFDGWAAAAGVSVKVLLGEAGRYIEQGLMRRFSAVLRHREAGFGANAMGAWAVPAGKQDAFGASAARYAAVSHCYLRPTYADWPYSVFTMVHGKSRGECEQVLSAIAGETGVNEFAVLYSSDEYKKVRVKYFTPEIEAWERDCLGGGGGASRLTEFERGMVS